MRSIKWLHLSDFHIGATGWDARWRQQVQPEFFERYLKTWIQRNGTLDLVFITGDLTYSATEEQFNLLTDKLTEFANVFQQEGVVIPKFAVVPGNHDFTPFNIQEIDALTKMALQSLFNWESDEVMQQAFFESDASPYINIIKKSFHHYLEWQQNNTDLLLTHTQTGYLPGDFSATYEKEGFKLGIIGLNSTFLQLTLDRSKIPLVVDARQFQYVCTQSDGFQQWVKNHNANILLTHHTPQNLNPSCRAVLKNILRFFAKHLCGHMRKDIYHEIDFRNVWQTPAFFGQTGLSQSQTLRTYGLSIGELVYADKASQQAESKLTLLKYMPVNDRIKKNANTFEEFQDRSIIDLYSIYTPKSYKRTSFSEKELHLKNDYETKIKQSEKKIVKIFLSKFSNILRDFEQEIGKEDEAILRKRLLPLIEIIRKEIIEEELNQRGQFRVLLKQEIEKYVEVHKKIIFLSHIIDRMEKHKNEILSEKKLRLYIGEIKKEIEQYSDILHEKIINQLDNLIETSYSSIELFQNQYQEIINILREEINEIDAYSVIKIFRPLIRELIDIELYKRADFVNFLSQPIDKLSKEKIVKLIKNYSIPKIKIAIFNKESFNFPSERDECSVISTQASNKKLEEQELSDVLDKIEAYYVNLNAKKNTFNLNKKSHEYRDKDGLWYFWSTNSPSERYLAVKMVKSFDDKEHEKTFIKHVSENVWNGLQKSKSTGEMQYWMDSFTQKDSNILNVDSPITKSIKHISKNRLPLYIFILLTIVIFWVWTELKLEIQILKQEIANSQRQLHPILSKSLKLNLINSEPFIAKDLTFKEKQIGINFLDKADLNRLKNIKNNIQSIIQLGGSVKLFLIPHQTPNTSDIMLNYSRAEAIKGYLMQGINKYKLTINIEAREDAFLAEKLYGVSIRLLSVD